MNNVELELPPDHESPPESPIELLEEYNEEEYNIIDLYNNRFINEILIYSDNMFCIIILDIITYIIYFNTDYSFINIGLITIIFNCIIKNTFNKLLLLLYILFNIIFTILRCYIYYHNIKAINFSSGIIRLVFFVCAEVYINYFLLYFYYIINKLKPNDIQELLDE